MDIYIKNLDQQSSLEIISTVPLWKIPKTLQQNWRQIKTHMKTAKIEQVGKPYARFIDINWDSVANDGIFAQMKQLAFGKQKIAVGIRVDAICPSSGEIHATNLESGEYAEAIHIGGVHKVGESYKLMVKWAAQQDIKLKNHSIEIYTHAPGDVKTSEMETILRIPIKS